MRAHYLDRLFAPRGIAVIGASGRPDSVGGRVFANLIAAGFEGQVYPVNPRHTEVLGRPCYGEIGQIGAPVDLAVIASPAATVPEVVHGCGEQGVRTAIVHSAGFRESGDAGTQLERRMLAEARRYRMRVLGPNCLGLIRPASRLNATFSKDDAVAGKLALVSQSGALCTAILDWAKERQIGFSAVVSLGDAADVGFGDLLDFLALDAQTRSILLYVEGIRDARGFMSGLRAAARLKPVVVVKAGRHAEGLRAAVSHTGAIVGGDDVFDAAIQRAGAVRANSVEQLFAAAQLLAMRHRVRGNRLAIVTNGGGPGVMATDRAIDLGVRIPELSESTLAALDAALPEHWSHGNPVDVLGDAPPERYRAATEACLADPGVDGLLVMLTPQAMTEPLATAKAMTESSGDRDKPVLACWMGAGHVAEARAFFVRHDIPTFDSPEGSVEAFAYLATHHRNQRLLMQVPGPLARRSEPDVRGAELIIDGALSEKRRVLSITESKALLAAFGIPVTTSVEVRTANEALVAAESLGFPVALKISSPEITHKTDVGGVRLNVADAASVRSAFNELLQTVREKSGQTVERVALERMVSSPSSRELFVGVARDPVFGPVIGFGAGGTTIEIHRDRAIALPPVNDFIASSLIDQTRVSRLLGPYRNLPAVDRRALEQLLRRVSEMVCELPRLVELDINPLLADENGVLAVDARIVVEPGEHRLERYRHMAIHPYPAHLVRRWQTHEGVDITIRPIRPEDAEIESRFVRELSPRSKYFRFMQALRELSPEMLVRFTQLDYDRELALIAVVAEDAAEKEIAVARYALNPDGESCEFAIVVADEWQGKGIGTEVMRNLMAAARERGIRTMEGEVLADNHHMLQMVQALGFETARNPDDPSVFNVVRSLV